MTTDKPTVPNEKGVIRGIAVGDDGRIWVRRFVAAEKGDSVPGLARQGEEPPRASPHPPRAEVRGGAPGRVTDGLSHRRGAF